MIQRDCCAHPCPKWHVYASDFDMDTNTWELEEIGLYWSY